jgi:site-specific recombinase XerD
MTPPHAPAEVIADFLADLTQANRSAHTYRAYATDLKQFATWYQGALEALTPGILRDYFLTVTHLRPATRARKQAAVASFLTWAYRQELIATNPMGRIERINRDPPAPGALARGQVEAILAVIPATQRRDRLLFRLLFETGLRVSEALALYIEDVDLTLDDERLQVLGKGNQRRTILLDDPRLVKELRTYLKQTGYQQGPLFRALKNGDGGPLRYQSVQERWATYCAKAGIPCTLHQLRHTHATELVNGGVSLATIRKRLGHKNIQTTLRYAELSDTAADAELRAWRRRRSARS